MRHNIRFYTKSTVKNILITLPLAMGFISCGGNMIQIKGEFTCGADSMVYIESFSALSQGAIIDSAKLDAKGEFTLKFESEEDELSIYNLIYNHQRIPLLLESGDKISINSIGDVINNYRIEGSGESEQLRNFYQPYVKNITLLNKIATTYADATLSESEKEKLAGRYTELYQSIRRQQIEYIIEHQSSLAAVYAISQRVAGDTYIFNAQSDIIYYKTLIEALEKSYPDTKYLKVLRNRLSELDLVNRLVSDVTITSLPEIELPDMYGTRHKLSESLGKVTLLEFWSSELGNSNTLNAELKELYEQYSQQGLVIYQVAVDPVKSRWVAAVQEQKLPWISVNDLNGTTSTALRLYNVTTLPANYLINGQGEIIAKDIHQDNLNETIQRELRR
ncbi:MAG: TlpA disulfide reductase family protein [Rikenellaceae bacterium]